MDDLETTGQRPQAVKRRFNWWKLAFFVLLIVFEITREIAVLEAAEGAQPNTRFTMSSFGNRVTAEGSWRRTDGKGKLAPTATTILCDKALNQCIEATTNIIDEHVFSPDVTHFDAQFGPDVITYTNSYPQCAKYTVRLDLKMEQVLATRQRTNTAGDCAMLEPLIRMRLGGWKEEGEFGLEIGDHFVPIISMISALA